MSNINMKLIIIVTFVCLSVKCNAISLDYYYAASDFYRPGNGSEEDLKQVLSFVEPTKVRINLFYEVFCPHCRSFVTETFSPVLEKLGRYLDIYTYPYGNANTVKKDNKIYFTCQHGPTECYGNKLHACALDIVKSNTQALKYNICMMKYSNSNQGSDDDAADKCGKALLIDSTPIKKCAKGIRGTELLKYCGEESKKANFKHVPHILINGVKNDGTHFMRDVCAAFAETPTECQDILSIN
ncbi:GILT-like protein 2 [Pieris napi]|uniref:GILT-like protein 2 n=1 Tax=Pieris napi TaxID=78633 RepID=UPI001FBABB46|nr:GILT-like protein 2 [Pieris napi]